MDNAGIRQPGGKHGRLRGQRVTNPNPQLFDDTSTQPQQGQYGMPPPEGDHGMGYSSDNVPNVGYDYNQGPNVGGYDQNQAYGNQGQYPQGNYGQQPPQQYPGQQFFNDPMTNVAVQYGSQLADQGKFLVQENLEKYGVSTNKLKYYFAVDTSYVGKKLGLLLFPYAHSDWSIQYDVNEPVQPRYAINAPDLYIPVMAFVTYILLAGVCLGTQNRFTPEQLGITCSTALVWMVIEIMVLILSMYVMNVSTDLRYLDLLSYCGYKYVGMLVAVMAGLLFSSMAYYIALLWSCVSLAFFLVRSLKLAITPHGDHESFTRGNKRRLYVLLMIAMSQPIFMWWLTYHLIQ